MIKNSLMEMMLVVVY